ncbi:MAG: ATP-binding protein [Parabacteroides sp.]|nr:ATP-binding protein [Parabacteroides sp.]
MNDTDKEIERLRKQLSQLEKMSGLGYLSAGIAHEIQNPLNFVINFSKLSGKLLKDMAEILQDVLISLPDETRDDLQDILKDLQGNMQKIEENGSRASNIVKGILLYSRGREDEFIPTNLCQLVKEYVWLSYHAARANNKSFNVTIQEDYDEHMPLIKVIPQDFSRAVLNLMNNACYAVNAREKCASEELYSPTIKVSLKQKDANIVLIIEDNGGGISDEVKEHLFTPFFTTKPIGEGTGLGLSITKGIIEQKHNGTIKVESMANRFTRFIITIPIQ